MKINKGDIVHLKWTALNGEEGTQVLQDKHPFIVLRNNDNENIIVCVISSADKVSKRFPYNVAINDWEKCNLSKPSHAKTDRIANITIDDIYRKIGHLSSEDYINVMTKFNKCPSSDYIVIEMIRR